MGESSETQPPLRSRRRALAIVPARLASVRLPRKMLLRETGRYLFQHTVENAQGCAALDRVVLATDSQEILDAAAEVGVEGLSTSPDHSTGTERVEEAWKLLSERGEGPWDVVVNVQGDEPELPVQDLERLILAFADPEVEMATLYTPIETWAEARDPSIVKVVCDERGDALYFSRAAIPSFEHPSRSEQRTPGEASAPEGLKRHVGVYAFRPEALRRFCALPTGALERIESLEQLRWLEAGGRIRVLAATRVTPGIDTQEHYAAFRRRIEDNQPLEGSKRT